MQKYINMEIQDVKPNKETGKTINNANKCMKIK